MKTIIFALCLFAFSSASFADSNPSEGLVEIGNGVLNRDGIWDTLCFKSVAAILHAHFASKTSQFIDFNQVYTSSDLGGVYGLTGFAKVETWGQSAAPHHINIYAVVGTCEMKGSQLVLRDVNNNHQEDLGDLNLTYIDFNRY